MKKLFPLIFLLSNIFAVAQDAQFSQFYQAPLYLNPGFTGSTAQQRLTVNHRLQWPGLQDAFSTYAVSYDIFLEELRSGMGVLFTSDKIGSAGWHTTTVNGFYSYKVMLSRNLVFSPGISIGYGTNGLDRTKLRMGDGLQYGGSTLDPELNKLGQQNYFDFGSGFLLYSKQAWLGVSFFHMNQPNLSVVNGLSRLPLKTQIHGGIKLQLNGDFRNTRVPYITPSFIYKMQGSGFAQMDVGINYHVDPIAVGLWYRGKPFGKEVFNTIDQDAMVAFFGLYLKNLTVGYSYDFTLSALQSTANGAHEISLTYEFKSRKSDKKKRQGLIPCPSFMSKNQTWHY